MFTFNKKAATVGELFGSFSAELKRIQEEQEHIAFDKQEEINRLAQERDEANIEAGKAGRLLENLAGVL